MWPAGVLPLISAERAGFSPVCQIFACLHEPRVLPGAVDLRHL